jgi:hypothetical protein
MPHCAVSCIAHRVAHYLAFTTCGVQVQTRRAEPFGNTGIAAHRTRHQTPQELALKIVFGSKPALKHVLLAALQV